MSEKAVYEFFTKVATDKGLQDRLTALPGVSSIPTPEAVGALLRIARDEGTPFSAADYEAVLAREPAEADGFVVRDADGIGVPYDCTGATAWRGHPPVPHGCSVAWGCGVDHPAYGGPHIPICSSRPV